MKTKLLEVLGCPECWGELTLADTSESAAENEILTGMLRCHHCQLSFRIERGIPRFVDPGNYATSFGFQWNRFRMEQLDSQNGTSLSSERFYRETGWEPSWMRGKWLLEVGCGAGRFLEVAAQPGAEVIGVDLSDAVDAAFATLKDKPNVHLIQASVYKLPIRRSTLDGCYCIGVLQHTPDPLQAAECLPPMIKPGGTIALTVYSRRWYTPLNAKYLIRPLTRRMNSETLLRSIKLAMPVLFPITSVLYKLPVFGHAFRFIIPVANYVEKPSLSREQRYQWAVLDTFDMLSPRYDHPPTEEQLSRALIKGGAINIKRLKNAGLNLIASAPLSSP